MFIKSYKIFHLIFSIIILNIKTTEATKCGDFFCKGNSECRYNMETEKLQCVCDEGNEAIIEGKTFNCQQTEIINDEYKCLNAGDKCGPKHNCNHYLVCEENHDENMAEVQRGEPKDLICNPHEEQCLERCCSENELCQGDKCVLKEVALNPEVASNDEVILNNDKHMKECPEPQKCLNNCCAANEECRNHNQCVAKGPLLPDCPKEQICQDSCCMDKEICNEEKKCVATEESDREDFVKVENYLPSPECPEAQQCQHKCCAASEKCTNGSECISQEQVSLNCPPHLQCVDRCCSETEICNDRNECVAHSNEWARCSESQRCGDKCCPINHICNTHNMCEVETKEQVSIPVLPSLSHNPTDSNCPLAQQCLDICCPERQKCSKSKECIPINTIECYETDVCGDKCCPINETCDENHQCVTFLEITTLENCPAGQICLDSCCSPLEVCNEFDECEMRITKTALKDSHDIEAQETAFNSVFPLYDFENIQTATSCPEDHDLCQQNCCNSRQRCTENGECLDMLLEDVTDKDCNFDNCAENLSDQDTITSIAYTLIGLGCLVMVLSFALFKVYVFRRTNRNVF